MRKLWHDIQTHKRAAALFLVYWLVTTVVATSVWFDTTQSPLLLATSPLIAGGMVALE
jgi:hypothetical protein